MTNLAFLIAPLIWALAVSVSPLHAQFEPATNLPVDAPDFLLLGESFVALRVVDIDEASTWYAGSFGMEKVNQIDADDGSYQIRLFRGPGLSLELIQAAGDQEVSDPHLGYFKVGLFVDDIDAALSWFQARGVRTDRSVFTDEALAARSFVTRDPWGNRLQFFEACEDDCGRP